VEGKLVGYILVKEVLYYFNLPSFINFQNSFFALTVKALEVFQHFKTSQMISYLTKIFSK